jgi:hypothetical protein
MKCIFDQTTGQVLTYTSKLQDHELMMTNWDNCAFIEVDFIPSYSQAFDYWVNPETLILELKP